MSLATAVVLVVTVLALSAAAVVIIVALAGIRGWVETRRLSAGQPAAPDRHPAASHPMFDTNQ